MSNFMPWKLATLETRFPSIRWTDPIMVHWEDGDERFACRICIANHGLQKLSKHQWPTFKACQQHIKDEHQ